jgi:hypothetical protein
MARQKNEGLVVSLSVRLDGTDGLSQAQKFALVNASNGRRVLPATITVAGQTYEIEIPLAVWGKGIGKAKVALAGDVGGSAVVKAPLAGVAGSLKVDESLPRFTGEKTERVVKASSALTDLLGLASSDADESESEETHSDLDLPS